jgi:hypothetical protein
MAYDEWKQTDLAAEKKAEQDAKIAALAAQIRAGLILSDYLGEIELDSSLDEKCSTAISEAFKTGTDCGAILHQYANDWLDNHAAELATQRLQGMQD